MYTTEARKHPVLTIGAVGALSTQKGFEVLIEALAHLKTTPNMPDWQCLIAGEGPMQHELKRQAETLQLAGSILFLGYRDSREVLPEIDILIIPSVDGEGSNAVIKEGWVTQTPVITSDLPSNLELVTHEHDGLVFRNRDASELAAAIVRLVNDQDLTLSLVANGSVSVTRYTDKTMADQYIRLYRDLVG
jgi:glycosyltransferase involved in cell wall biosynthesis